MHTQAYQKCEVDLYEYMRERKSECEQEYTLSHAKGHFSIMLMRLDEFSLENLKIYIYIHRVRWLCTNAKTIIYVSAHMHFNG